MPTYFFSSAKYGDVRRTKSLKSARAMQAREGGTIRSGPKGARVTNKTSRLNAGRMKTFRLKRRAKAYQKLHGGRITGTTGSYQVKKNLSRRKSKKRTRAAIKRLTENGVRKVKRPAGWVKARAVKFESGRVLIRR